jgi:hypothetical protein
VSASKLPSPPKPQAFPSTPPIPDAIDLLAETFNRPELLTDWECFLGWSQGSRHAQELRVYIWNHTPRSQSCKVTLLNLKRFSKSQQLYVDDSNIRLYAYDLISTYAAPEDQHTLYTIIEATSAQFAVLGVRRDHRLTKTREGQWQLNLKIRLGDRERRQDLVFFWDKTIGLAPLQIGENPRPSA